MALEAVDGGRPVSTAVVAYEPPLPHGADGEGLSALRGKLRLVAPCGQQPLTLTAAPNTREISLSLCVGARLAVTLPATDGVAWGQPESDSPSVLRRDVVDRDANGTSTARFTAVAVGEASLTAVSDHGRWSVTVLVEKRTSPDQPPITNPAGR